MVLCLNRGGLCDISTAPLPTLLAPQADVLASPRCRAARARNGLSEEGLDVLARDR